MYLAESIRAWPDQAGLAAVMYETGWDKVQWRNPVRWCGRALHRAWRASE